MPNSLSEASVQKHVVKWLTSNGWGRIDYKEPGEHGVDIKARNVKYGRFFFIECKGDPDPAEVKHPQANRDVKFMNALGQIVTRMGTDAGYYYGIAVPRSFESLVYGRVPWRVCRKLSLRFLLVEDDGTVKQLTWRNLRRGRPSGPKAKGPAEPPRHPKKKPSGWDIMKRQMPNSKAVTQRLERAKRMGRSASYIRSLESLRRVWEKQGK